MDELKIFLGIFAFLFGLCIGSFLNVLIFRLPEKETLGGRSHCAHCRRTLHWYDLFPLFSFAFLRGKCRYCGEKISWQYPLVELSTALLFLAGFIFYGIRPLFFLYALVAAFWVLVFVFDIKYLFIPDVVLYFGIVASVALGIFSFPANIVSVLIAGVAIAAFFGIFVLVSRGKWMGGGDIFLGAALGFGLGFPAGIVGLFATFLIGAAISMGLVLAKKKGFKAQVPLGCFMAPAFFIALFWGQAIATWYINLIR